MTTDYPPPGAIKTETDNLDDEEDTTEDDDDKDDLLKEGCKDNGSKPPYSYVAMIGKLKKLGQIVSNPE